LFELPKFAGFSRQTSRFQQFGVFGRFRTILLCCEHETSRFMAITRARSPVSSALIARIAASRLSNL
jgi:hypothetical protein